MEIYIRNIPFDADIHDLKRKIEQIVHSDQFPLSRVAGERGDTRLLNFQVYLKPSEVGHLYSDGHGRVVFPTARAGHAFLDHIDTYQNLKRFKNNKLAFKVSKRDVDKATVQRLLKTPHIPVDIEERYDRIVSELDHQLRVNEIQIGLLYHKQDSPRSKSRLTFSAEWTQDLVHGSVGWLKVDYASKLIRLKLGNPTIEAIGHNVLINFSNIRRIILGQDGPHPYVCMSLDVPSVLEEVDFHAASNAKTKTRRRVSALDARHARIAPYAHDIHLVLYHENEVLQTLKRLCRVGEIEVKCEELKYPDTLDTHGPANAFFTEKILNKLDRWFKELPFPVAFQIEGLLRHGLLTSQEILAESWRAEIAHLAQEEGSSDAVERLSQLLMHFKEDLRLHNRDRGLSSRYFEPAKLRFKYTPNQLSAGSFSCCHLTFTPTRILLEGPFPTQSNRIMRKYHGHEHNFMRVDFRDEDRVTYRWDQHVDSSQFLQDRVGRTLNQGFEIGGKYFEFLAYSSSALREHAVWFMHSFQLQDGSWVTPSHIRGSLGDFDELIKQPSKLAARVAQAFTATDPSVRVHRSEWEEIDDILDQCKPPNKFTDGCGLISRALATEIWKVLCSDRRRPDQGFNAVEPTVYQIRFLGFKGVVSVCPELDSHPRGIKMQLRKSMKKFENRTEEWADIEIARAFDHPNLCYLNRPLVMLLEDRNVRREAFERLQNLAVEEAMTIDSTASNLIRLLQNNSLGDGYRLGWIVERVQGLMGTTDLLSWDNPFWRRLRNVAVNHVLRDIKHRARIRIPDSYLLVGIADEGPAYEQAGDTNVYTLPPSSVYVCIQKDWKSERTWLEGGCLIGRNPVVHPGDVQRVHAIGKPPADQICSFRDIVNAVVLPSQGKRALASCLSGGDVDGDQFMVIQCESLMAVEHHPAADYLPAGVRELDRECTVEDVCDFIVEYIQSDVLGLLSVRHLIIADQSLNGTKDPKCLRIAEMCSQAVDYPKNGIPVDATDLPKTLLRCNPDWQAAEVLRPRDTDFYRSERALGYLYRAIDLEDLPADKREGSVPPLCDPISICLKANLSPWIETEVDVYSIPNLVTNMFQRYTDELRCISATHTISNTPGARLIEEELVIGTILAKCSQHRLRTDRTERLKYHTRAHVHNFQQQIRPTNREFSQEEEVTGLERAWFAWALGQHRREEFGAESFSLMALKAIFESLELLTR